MYATEPPIIVDKNYEGYGLNAEKTNGRWAMIGIVAGVTSYALTGSFFFGGILGF